MPRIFSSRKLKKIGNKKITPKHWMFKIHTGEDFYNSKDKKVWGLSSKGPINKTFVSDVNIGDKLWFIKSNKQIAAVADYVSHTKRLTGPLINITYSDKELGWKNMAKADIQINFENLKEINDPNFKYQFNFISEVTLNNQMNSYMNMGHEYEKLP